MLEVVVRAALCTLLLAFLIQLCLRALRVRHAQLLLSTWTAVLIASMAMPALLRTMPSIVPAPLSRSFSMANVMTGRTLMSSVTNSGASSVAAAINPAATSPRSASPAVSAPHATAPHAEKPQQPLRWRAWLTAAYVLVTSVLLFRLLLGLGLSWRLLRAACPVDDGWAADKTNVKIRTSLNIRTSTWVSAPVTIGATVLLPAECANWDARQCQAVLAHEASHVARGDFYVQLLSQLNRALFWFSPLSWWLHRRLAALAELASDDAAIEALGDRPGYAAILLDVARLVRTPSLGVAMARPATVSLRIERILAERTAPRRVSLLRQVLIAAAVAPVATCAAALFADAAPQDAVVEQQAPHTRIAIDPKLLDAYVGFYLNPTTGSLMIVTREDDHLLTRRAGNQPVPEYPYTDHDFFLTASAQQNSFITDASGAVVRVVHHQRGRDESLDRITTEAAQQTLQRFAEERAPHTAISIDPHLLDGYVGTYQLNPQFVFTVTREGDRLLARLTGQQTFEVHPYTERDFFYTIVAAQLSFVPGPDGKASAVVLHQNGRDQTAARVDPGVAEELDRKRSEQAAPRAAIKIDPALLDLYVGRYSNPEIEMTATREGEQLFVRVTGYSRYRVFPYTDHDFFATIGSIQVSFASDGKTQATQLIRHQNGKDDVMNREQ